MRNKLVIGVMAAALVVACGKQEADHPGHVEGEAPHAHTEAPAAAPAEVPAEAPAPATPTAQHGGQVVSMGEYHAEVVAGDEVEAYFFDLDGKPMAPPSTGMLHISMADGHRSSIPMKSHDDHLSTGHGKDLGHAHPPYDAAISVELGGQTLNFRFTVAE